MVALNSTGCACSRFSPPQAWRLFSGRPQIGLMVPAMADLNLRVAMVLHEMHLPSAMLPQVLSFAVQDFVNEVAPTDAYDWWTLARTAQALSRERVEDYVAMAAAVDGPLVPEDIEGTKP
jgi:hypothetical protein